MFERSDESANPREEAWAHKMNCCRYKEQMGLPSLTFQKRGGE